MILLPYPWVPRTHDNLPRDPQLKQAPEQEDTETIINTMPTSNRIPYKNGYGEFFFGRISSWEKKPIMDDMSEEEKQELMGIAGSNGVPIVELDGFQRSGPFPYTKLPFEIRQMILRILLQPVFSKYRKGGIEVEYTRLQIQSLQDPFDDDSNFNYGSEDLYTWSEERARRRRTAMCYPGRNSLYLLALDPVRAVIRDGPRTDWVFLEWIRQASQVSTSFRYELGQVLWANAEIDGRGCDDNHHAIKDFLLERPWVHDSIKRLDITLEISRGQDVKKCDVFFDDWCDYIAKSLDLESVWFTIYVSGRDLEQFVNGEDNGLNGLNAASKLRVSQYFDVILNILDDDFDDIFEDTDELHEEYEAIVLEYMMPLSLQIRTTEGQQYLQARASSAEEAGRHPSAD